MLKHLCAGLVVIDSKKWVKLLITTFAHSILYLKPQFFFSVDSLKKKYSELNLYHLGGGVGGGGGHLVYQNKIYITII